MRIVLFTLSMLLLVLWFVIRIVASVQFDRACDGHLKRAADANTVELAKTELETALAYIESNGLTSGYTSVLYTTPDEDIGFWHSNLTASLKELNAVDPNASQLEKTNLLMKLRQTLLDEGQHVTVTVPDGISVYPHNLLCSLPGFISLLVFAACAISFIVSELRGY